MESLHIEKTKNTPFVNLDLDKKVFEVKGPSYSEDVSSVYDPILNWIENEIPNLNASLVCELYFDVLNSVSHKKIFQILIKLNSYHISGKQISVKWLHDEDDEDILEMGEDLVELVDLPFEIVAVES